MAFSPHDSDRSTYVIGNRDQDIYDVRETGTSDPFLFTTTKFNTINNFNMPLVVPGINSAPDSKSDWANKLMGKKLSDTTSDVNVCLLSVRLERSYILSLDSRLRRRTCRSRTEC